MTHHIDWDKVDNYFISGSSITQCAHSLGVSVDTLERHCRKEKNAEISQYQQQKRERGNALIHAAQFEKAIKDKNPTMLIWLGKQRLGQRDTIDESTSPPNNTQIKSDHKLVKMQYEILKLREILKENGIQFEADQSI